VSRPDLEPRPFSADSELTLRGETVGEGRPVVLCHGLTATRRQILHGSVALPRRGHLVVQYDARGHGDSDPASDEQCYDYPSMVADLESVIAETVGESKFVLGGHSMGSHAAVAYALEHPERVAGLVVIGPVYPGRTDAAVEEEALERWDELAGGLERGGVDGFLEALERQGIDHRWRDSVLRFTRERMQAHRHPEAVVRALREVPRSRPFETIDELEFCDVPALVVASHDVADPGHPCAVAEAYAARLPRAKLVSEDPGDAPLAWKGGLLSREIAGFCAEPAVAQRLEKVA
jgi:pimeloyl-ACP methyl ester carboxylesterase